GRLQHFLRCLGVGNGRKRENSVLVITIFLFYAPKAEQLFRENIKRAAELGVKASPTIFVDGHKFRANQLLRASGTPCQ
ncbi:MAG: hypothetical protein OXI63_25185, partial [Candidatus Poribacteria bacterium]|nr:hypothetical protein [Candidatus Poribacteria bacterium]